MPARSVIWGPTLRLDYEHLFENCKVKPERLQQVNAIARKICSYKSIYEQIGSKVGCPWWVVGVIHYMECNLRFTAHLHNGDPLTERTVRVPAGRPLQGEPPFSFEESAIDALNLKGFTSRHEKDWSIARMLFLFEGFNGYGYRMYHPEVKSPYLWSFTNWYVKGKYVADGKWNSKTVSQQAGIAAIMKCMESLGVSFS